MILPALSDWDDAYANRAHIPGADEIIAAWETRSKAFRAANPGAALNIGYRDSTDSKSSRCAYDLFPPETGDSRGLFVFVHGGYWVAFDKNNWSHLAEGARAAGFTVMMPSYPLCPDVGIADIQQCVAESVVHAAKQVDGPIVLTGHSAGGHLVTSLVSTPTALPKSVVQRIQHVVSISGVHDLRPLLNTALNDHLKLDLETAARLSPALQEPLTGIPVTAWVGGAERAEFLRQNALLANVWRGLGVATTDVREPDRHHFNIIDGLCDHNSPLMRHTLSVF